MQVLIGRWTFANREKGIVVCDFDSNTGNISEKGAYFPETNVGCIYVEKDLKRLFIADERDGLRGSDGGSGYVLSASYDDQGQLEFISEVPSMACTPTYVYPLRDGKYLLTAHHGMRKNHATRVVKDSNGTFRTEVVYDQAPLMVFRLNRKGEIGELVDVWAESEDWSTPDYKPHLHCVGEIPGGGIYIVTDPGTDSIFSFKVDENGKISILDKLTVEKEKMPRYVVFHPTLPIFYANNERGSLIYSYQYDAVTGSLKKIGSCNQLLPEYCTGKANEPSDIKLAPNGKYLYGAVRGDDVLTCMCIREDGSLETIQNIQCGGIKPRSIDISPDGKCLLSANQNSNSIAVFNIAEDGTMEHMSDFSISDPGALAFIN